MLDYELCRDLMHAWSDYTASRLSPTRYLRTLVCSRCGTEKVQLLSQTGAILRSRYIYPSDYARPKGSGRITAEERQAIRLATLTQALKLSAHRK